MHAPTCGGLAQGSLHKPPTIGCRPQPKPRWQEHAPKQQAPEAKKVQGGEPQYRRADHQRYDIVTETNKCWYHKQEDHGGTRHGENLIVYFWAQPLAVWYRQLGADEKSLHTAHHEEN